MRVTIARIAAAALILIAVCAPPARAQGFGKNKVHYESLSWSVLQTPHVRLHYYAQEESLARGLAAFAESTAVEFDARFRVKIRHRVPVLLYSTHHLFQQTNATPEQLSEAVGGLTELIKGRVLLPHNGSWARLRWVTRHELTHAYQLEKFEQVMHAHHRPPNWFPPLWFTEGLAEHCGTTWDADAEGLLRDMVCSRMAYPMTRSEPITGSVEMYKEGQHFLDWLSAKYGDGRIFDLLDNAWRGDDFDTVFKLTYGRALREVDDEWFESVQKHFFPAVATCTRPEEVARPFRQLSRFNLGVRVLPAVADSDTTTRFCYFEADEGAQDLVLSERGPNGKRRERRLLRGGDRVRTLDGREVEIIAADEALLEAFSADPLVIAKAAYHLGNRHVAVQVLADRLRFLDDHVLGDMVKGLGLMVRSVLAPFEPEGGAYGHHHAHGSQIPLIGPKIHEFSAP